MPLAANGGSTRTHALRAGSPAIDAGSNEDALDNDQRGPGHPRVAGAAADIGAYEWTLPPSLPVPGLSRHGAWWLVLALAMLVAGSGRRSAKTKNPP